MRRNGCSGTNDRRASFKVPDVKSAAFVVADPPPDTVAGTHAEPFHCGTWFVVAEDCVSELSGWVCEAAAKSLVDAAAALPSVGVPLNDEYAMVGILAESNVPLVTADAAIATDVLPAAVRRPFASTVNVATVDAEP